MTRPPVPPSLPSVRAGVPIRRNQPCPCGSGRRHKECCARVDAPPPRPTAATGQDPAAAIARAQRHRHNKEFAAAEEIALQLLDHDATHGDALRLLADLKQEVGDLAAATAYLRQLTHLSPGNDDLLCELAHALHHRQELMEAERHARQAVAINPNNAQAHNLVGMILADSHRYEEAELYYREVLKLHVPVAGLCANLAAMKVKLGKLEEAEFLYRETLRLEPGNIDGLLDWVRLREARRDLDGAWQLLHTALAQHPNSLPCLYVASTLHRRGHRFEEALTVLEQAAALIREHHLDPPVAYLEQRGTVLDALGRYDEAFAAFEQANTQIRRHQQVAYNRQRAQENAQRLQRFFTRERLARLPFADEARDAASGRAQPIFIIGFPRSGTTLVEEMLSGHPLVAAADELPYIGQLTRIIQGTLRSKHSYPDCLEELSQSANHGMIDKLRSYYLVNVESRALYPDGCHYFTDKMPLNETNLGLIHLLFPTAPIIHLIRHPLDVVLSTFFTDLTHGGFCSYRLETAASHYALTFELLQHYRQNLDLRYLPIRYEELVHDPEPHIRRMLAFINEPWDDRCLRSHHGTRVARTASYAQVAEKVHTRSVYRFRNYARHLTAVIPILRPAITRLDYPLE